MGRNLVKNVEDLWDNYNKDKKDDTYDIKWCRDGDYNVELKNMLEDLESPKSVAHINSRIMGMDKNGLQVVHCGQCHYEGSVGIINITVEYVRGVKVNIGSSRCGGCGKIMFFIRRVIK